MNLTDLETAVSQIHQACEGTVAGERLPFFFLVGSGISCPAVPLASEIEKDCKITAHKYDRKEDPTENRPIDTYSHWFAQAYPQPLQRQRYLRKLIEGKPITHANLRLSHLISEKRFQT